MFSPSSWVLRLGPGSSICLFTWQGVRGRQKGHALSNALRLLKETILSALPKFSHNFATRPEFYSLDYFFLILSPLSSYFGYRHGFQARARTSYSPFRSSLPSYVVIWSVFPQLLIVFSTVWHSIRGAACCHRPMSWPRPFYLFSNRATAYGLPPPQQHRRLHRLVAKCSL